MEIRLTITQDHLIKMSQSNLLLRKSMNDLDLEMSKVDLVNKIVLSEHKTFLFSLCWNVEKLFKSFEAFSVDF